MECIDLWSLVPNSQAPIAASVIAKVCFKSGEIIRSAELLLAHLIESGADNLANP
jgi:hypothetical protein